MSATAQDHALARARAPRVDRPAGRFLNRDLSWLDFDRRVLELAADPSLPLLERVRLCSIVSSNLDEFFGVRIGGLLDQVAAGAKRGTPDGLTPAEVLAAARARVLGLQAAQDVLWLDELRPALTDEGIPVVTVAECGKRQRRQARKQFERWVQPLLTPIAVGPAAPFPYVRSLGLSIGALVRTGAAADRRFVHVNVPDDLPRFVSVGEVHLALEDLIAAHLESLLPTDEIEAAAPFRITRHADFPITGEVDDLLEAAELQLSHRRFGDVVRLELPSGTAPALAAALQRVLGVGTAETYDSAAPLGLSALAGLAELHRPDLLNKPWRPVTRRCFTRKPPAELLTRIRRRDILAHHPYESFNSSVEAFVAASRDPDVAAVKATVYRTGDSSATLDSLVRAAKEEKHAACIVELSARFDERKNIDWSRALDRAGVRVVYGVPELKVHAKLVLLVRHEGKDVRRYAHIGTGNYNSSNATSFEDLSLFTADKEIAADVADVFNAVTSRAAPAGFRKLLVGPWFLRDGFREEVERVRVAARAGEAARIRIKVNSLADPEIVEALYAASADGVDVEIVARGICALRPGVPGLSERITVRSVLGRFLEHSRIFWFQAGDNVSVWIGSADLMTRNLDRRVEVMAPIEDVRLRGEVAAVLDALAAETRSSWELDAAGGWSRTAPAPGKRAVSAQETLMTRARRRAK